MVPDALDPDGAVPWFEPFGLLVPGGELFGVFEPGEVVAGGFVPGAELFGDAPGVDGLPGVVWGFVAPGGVVVLPGGVVPADGVVAPGVGTLSSCTRDSRWGRSSRG